MKKAPVHKILLTAVTAITLLEPSEFSINRHFAEESKEI